MKNKPRKKYEVKMNMQQPAKGMTRRSLRHAARRLRRKQREMFEAAEAVGNVVNGEIWDFGCES
jgi:hypothetical protein